MIGNLLPKCSTPQNVQAAVSSTGVEPGSFAFLLLTGRQEGFLHNIFGGLSISKQSETEPQELGLVLRKRLLYVPSIDGHTSCNEAAGQTLTIKKEKA